VENNQIEIGTRKDSSTSREIFKTLFFLPSEDNLRLFYYLAKNLQINKNGIQEFCSFRAKGSG